MTNVSNAYIKKWIGLSMPGIGMEGNSDTFIVDATTIKAAMMYVNAYRFMRF
ncbi:MAG: hypothetical protein MJZ95_01815 [Paludibacteraceae bacterium]|nr:hypothetical protein [Paludibacteraceae bacterium]